MAGFDIDACATPALGGAGALEFAPLDEIDATLFEEWAVLAATHNQQAPAGVSTWYSLPYAPESGAWQENQQRNDFGVFFNVTVSALISVDGGAIRSQLDAMKNRRFLLRVTRSGTPRLIGTVERPLRFESRFESGASGGDTAGHRVTFQGVTIQKSPNYTPVF